MTMPNGGTTKKPKKLDPWGWLRGPGDLAARTLQENPMLQQNPYAMLGQQQQQRRTGVPPAQTPNPYAGMDETWWPPAPIAPMATPSPVPTWDQRLAGAATQAEAQAAATPKTPKELQEEELARQFEVARKRNEAIWSIPIPGGAKEGEQTTLSDGSTGYWVRDENGYPQFRQLTKPQQKLSQQEALNLAAQSQQMQNAPYYKNREIEEAAADRLATERYRNAQLSATQQGQVASQNLAEKQFEFMQQQAAAQQADKERQYRSQLAANPRSWLEYASYTGESPVIQPWMLPLMPQQYAGQVPGANIPGYQAGESMTSLPGLTPPSMQYLARMGPTARSQWLGYQQAQGGLTPEEAQFRMQSTAPPGGRNMGLTWGR